MISFFTLSFGQRTMESGPESVRTGYYRVHPFRQQMLDETRIKITIWGEVENPGVYFVPDYASLIDLLAIAGGPTSDANLSKIKIITPREKNFTNKSDGEQIINLEYYLEKGRFKVTPYYSNGSVIIVSGSGSKKFFDSLPKVLNLLNLITLTIVLVNWLR